MRTIVPSPHPYLCQFDNELHPGGSCNMTSLGMALLHYGRADRVPGARVRVADRLLNLCDTRGTDRHDLAVIAAMAREFGLNDNAGYYHSFADIKQHLAGGNIVIVQGDFTPSGHVIVVLGVDEEKGAWLCNDPAGDHRAPNGYSNPGWLSGEQVWYPSTWFNPAAAPDGKVWAHLLGKA